MAWVKFNRDFSWKPTSQSTIVYKAGSTYNVKSDAAERAVSRGAAVKMEKKTKTARPKKVSVDGTADQRG